MTEEDEALGWAILIFITTNLKDSQGNIVCIDDEWVDISNGRKCWLLSGYDGLYIRYDY